MSKSLLERIFLPGRVGRGGEGCFSTARAAWSADCAQVGRAELGAGGLEAQGPLWCRDGRNMGVPQEGREEWEPRPEGLRAHQQTEEFPEAGR